MRYIGQCAIVFCLSCIIEVPICLGDAKEDRNALGVLAEGYLNNRESFRFVDCRFELTQTQGKTIQDILAGRFVGKKLIKRGHWLVNGASVRYELICDPDVTSTVEKRLKDHFEVAGKEPSRSGKDTVPAECIDKLYLSSDSHSMTYGPFNLTANLFPKAAANPPGIRETPLSMNVMGANELSNPARFLQDCLSGRFVGHYMGTERINGVETAVATVGCEGFQDYKYGFDPMRGYLLIYYTSKDHKSGTRYNEVFVTDAKQCSDGRWFPMRSVLINNPDSTGPWYVEEIKVVQLDVDSEPGCDRFFLDIPARAHVNVPNEKAWVNLTKAERISAGDLANLYTRCVEHGKEYLANTAKDAKEQQGAVNNMSGARLGTLIVSSVLLVILVVIFIARRRRRYGLS